jgi:hypothetical protein
MEGLKDMDSFKSIIMARKNIAVRMLYTILFIAIFEVVKGLAWLTVLIQYALLLITTKKNERLVYFGNRLSAFAYKILRFTTLNQNEKPFPFGEFPKEMDKTEDNVEF